MNMSPGMTPYYGGFGPRLVAVIWALFGVATIVIVLRLITHFAFVKKGAGWSLVWALLAYSIAVPSNVLYTLAAFYGLGNHIQLVLTDPYLPTALMYEWIAACTISFSVLFGKMSAAAFIFSVQGPTHQIGKRIIIFFLAINLVGYIGTPPFIFRQCTPYNKLWDETVPGSCDGINQAYKWAIFNGAWGAAADLVLALYPAYLIWNLQMRLRLKIILICLMGLGVFTAVASLIKTASFGRLRTTTDATYSIAPLMLWGAVEMWVVLIAGGAAPLWPLISRTAQSLRDTARGSNYNKGTLMSHLKPRHYGKSGTDGTSGAHEDFRRLGSLTSSREHLPANNVIEVKTETSVRHEAIMDEERHIGLSRSQTGGLYNKDDLGF